MKPHGTITRYVAGCRCDDCRTANTNYRSDRRATRVGRSDTPHGVGGYLNWGCRCDACTVAHKAKLMERRDVAPKSERHRQPWTGPELELADRPDLTAAEIARTIGRSVSAVENMRQKLGRDPMTIIRAGVAREVPNRSVGKGRPKRKKVGAQKPGRTGGAS